MYSLLLFTAMTVLGLNHSEIPTIDTVSTCITIPVESSFKSIVIYNDITVYIIEGEQNKIIVKDEDVAGRIKFKVKDEILSIRAKNSLLGRNKSVKVSIMVRNINDITIIGNSEVRTIGDLSYRNLKLEIYGDGVIFVNTKAVEVNTYIQGLGKIEVRGNFKHTSVNPDAYGNMITTYN